MIDFQTANQLVSLYLVKMENTINESDFVFHKGEKHPRFHLVITQTTEYDFGWVFFYDAKELLEQDTPASILAGNAL